MISILTLTLVLGAQSVPTVCDSLSNEEVATVIGTVKSKNPIIDAATTCVWTGDRVTFSIMRTPDIDDGSAGAVLDSLKTRAQKGDVVSEEAGIGRRAVSEVMARGTSVSIFAVAGTTMWTIRVEHAYSGLKGDELLPKLRAIAKKLVR